MKNTSIRRASKSNLSEHQNEQEGSQKKSQGLLQGQAHSQGQEREIDESDFTRGYKLNEPCSNTSISSQAVEDLASRAVNSEEYEQLSLLKSTPTHKQSCDRTSQEYQSTQISKITTQSQENLTSLPAVSPALAQVTQEVERDLNIQLPLSGGKVSDALSKLNPNSVFLSNLKELSDEDLELFLGDSDWQDTITKLKQSRRRSLEQDTRDSDYLSFPTLTSNENSTTRPAGQTKCERWFRSKGLIPNGSQLGSEAIATIMGFPLNWFDSLSPTEPQAESEVDTSQEEPLPQDKQPSPSVESSISIPCLVKQPHKQPFEGLIVGDRVSEFDVQVGDRVVQLPKLYVFPNPPKRIKCRTDDDISPSKIPQRRKKGTGSGYINWRDIRKNGKDYKQTWFHYELWDKGRQVKSCKYIPKGKRSQVEKMNAEKVPVEEILKILKNRGKK